MSETQNVDKARRRLAAMLLGAPLAGALHTASQSNAAARADGGGDFTGRWEDTFAA